jgi:hypothetical protein
MTGFADGDAVGGGDPDNWENLGSAGGDWVMTTANQRPTYQTNEVNGLPVVRFSSSPASEEDRLISTPLFMSSFITTSAYTGFIVVRPTIGGGTDGSARYYRRPRILGTSGNDSFHVGLYDQKFALNHNSVTGPKILTPNTFTLNAWAIVEFYYDGTTMSIRFNGGTEGTIAGGTTGSLSVVGGLGFGTDLKFDGDIAEVIAWNVDIGATDRTVARTALGAKYGITV